MRSAMVMNRWFLAFVVLKSTSRQPVLELQSFMG